MKKPGFQNRFMILALVCMIEGMIALITLMIIPADPKNALFLGYSLERWALMGGVLLSLGVILFVILTRKNSYWGEVVDRLLRSRWVAMLFLLIFIVVRAMIGVYRENYALFLRLSPVVVYGILVSIQLIAYQRTVFREIEGFDEKEVSWLDRKNVLLWLALLGAVPLLFASAVKQEYPLGFAGMWTLMAEQIAGANFQLPLGVPYYGPGGVPFAYPPLGLYLMAVFLKLGGSAWSYLRYVPPVFSLLALVPLFLLARRVSKSNLGGTVAAFLAAGSYSLYYQQTESGGIVRGLAFGLGLLALYFFDRMVDSFRWRDAVLSGLFFGLTVLSHLGYAYYFALWIGAWVLTHPKRQTWIMASVVGAESVMVTLPWIVLMLERYGVSIFSSALLSHNNVRNLSLIQYPVNLYHEMLKNLQTVIEKPWFLVLVVAGLICLVVKRKFTLPLLFLLVLIILPEGNRFILTVSFIVVGFFISFLYRIITTGRYITNRPLVNLVSSIVLVGMFVPVYLQSFDQLSRQFPQVNQEMLEMASFMRNNTPSQAIYLDEGKSDAETEWLPYLTQREPILGYWGSEWTGTYNTQVIESGKLGECGQSLSCIEDWLVSIGKQPGYIIMDETLYQLSASLEQSPEWKCVFSNQRYIIWAYKKGN